MFLIKWKNCTKLVYFRKGWKQGIGSIIQRGRFEGGNFLEKARQEEVGANAYTLSAMIQYNICVMDLQSYLNILIYVEYWVAHAHKAIEHSWIEHSTKILGKIKITITKWIRIW